MIKANYNMLYKENSKFWGEGPNPLIFQFRHAFTKKGVFLDLGFGQGRDLFYMNNIGFKVIALEFSKIAVEQVLNRIKNEKRKNITIIYEDVIKFKFKKNTYDIININNLLQFIPKNDALEIIRNSKKNIKKKGLIFLSAITEADPSFKKNNPLIHCHFKSQELLKLFNENFKLLYYHEGIIEDKGHGKMPDHKHGITKIVVMKI